MDDIAADIASQPEKCVTTMNDIAIPQGKSLYIQFSLRRTL